MSFPDAPDFDTAATVFLESVTRFVEAAAGLDDPALLDPARCRGWSRLETVVHVRLGLEEMLLGSAHRVEEAPDHDAVSYWSAFAADAATVDAVDRVLHLRRTASAHRRPSGAVRHLESVAANAPAVVAALPHDGVVRFQGQRLAARDFLVTWAVEVACHHLDLALPPGSPAAPPAALDLTLRTLEALAGEPMPQRLTQSREPADVVLAALGRVPWPPEVPASGGYPVAL